MVLRNSSEGAIWIQMAQFQIQWPAFANALKHSNTKGEEFIESLSYYVFPIKWVCWFVAFLVSWWNIHRCMYYGPTLYYVTSFVLIWASQNTPCCLVKDWCP